MVVHTFPVAKLGLLLLKFINKPIAGFIRSRAQTSAVFRSYVCKPPAHVYNWCEVKTKMYILNLGRPVNIPPLNEAVAIDLGANLLGEAIIFATAANTVISEYNKSVKKETDKEEAKKTELATLKNIMKDLFIKKDEQAAQLRELSRKIRDIESKINSAILN